MAWFVLILAGFCEIAGVMLMTKLLKEKTILALLYLIAAFGLSFSLLSIALSELPMGTAYAVWTGIGTAGGAAAGMVFNGESTDRRRIFFIALILVSVIGLKWLP